MDDITSSRKEPGPLRGYSFCRYYNGEEDCPFPVDSLQAGAWKIERLWCYVNDEHIQYCLEDYVRHGMSNFRTGDDIPVLLKAFLMNRFFQYNSREDIDAFIQWYDTLYAARDNANQRSE